jgi:hypothetical protein
MLARLAVKLIEQYQKYISPDHSWAKVFFRYGCCKYHPTCSEYTKQCFQKYGFIRGLLKGSYRILRCNPYSKGGLDLP